MADIAADHQRFIEEDILGFFRSYPMTFPILVRVGFIPFKTGTRFERVLFLRHTFSICLSYTQGNCRLDGFGCSRRSRGHGAG